MSNRPKSIPYHCTSVRSVATGGSTAPITLSIKHITAGMMVPSTTMKRKEKERQKNIKKGNKKKKKKKEYVLGDLCQIHITLHITLNWYSHYNITTIIITMNARYYLEAVLGVEGPGTDDSLWCDCMSYSGTTENVIHFLPSTWKWIVWIPDRRASHQKN